MPNRRVPQRSVESAQGTHLLSAFRGALDGASAVPSPVITSTAGTSQVGDCSQLYFHQDRFTATGGVQTLSLTYIPVLNSEHVYCYPSGSRSGRYQRQNKAWEREVGKRDVRVLNGMNTRPGDVVVVEYAYYEQTFVNIVGPYRYVWAAPTPRGIITLRSGRGVDVSEGVQGNLPQYCIQNVYSWTRDVEAAYTSYNGENGFLNIDVTAPPGAPAAYSYSQRAPVFPSAFTPMNAGGYAQIKPFKKYPVNPTSADQLFILGTWHVEWWVTWPNSPRSSRKHSYDIKVVNQPIPHVSFVGRGGQGDPQGSYNSFFEPWPLTGSWMDNIYPNKSTMTVRELFYETTAGTTYVSNGSNATHHSYPDATKTGLTNPAPCTKFFEMPGLTYGAYYFPFSQNIEQYLATGWHTTGSTNPSFLSSLDTPFTLPDFADYKKTVTWPNAAGIYWTFDMYGPSPYPSSPVIPGLAQNGWLFQCISRKVDNASGWHYWEISGAWHSYFLLEEIYAIIGEPFSASQMNSYLNNSTLLQTQWALGGGTSPADYNSDIVPPDAERVW